jgi:hypothetical protein
LNRAEPAPTAKKSPASAIGLFILFTFGRVLTGILLASSSVSALGQSPTEYEVKAAFLFNFAKFVEWPATVFSGSETPFRICILGRDPFGNGLEQIVAGKKLDRRQIEIARPMNSMEAKNCQILFIASSEARQVPQILEHLKGVSVLTVADTNRFALMGGMISFVRDDDRVRFEINVQAADAAHLKLSARLMTVAKRVLGQEGAGTLSQQP